MNGVTATVDVTLPKTFMRHLADKIAANHTVKCWVMCGKNAFCCSLCYKSVHLWQQSEMEETNGDSIPSRIMCFIYFILHFK